MKARLLGIFGFLFCSSIASAGEAPLITDARLAERVRIADGKLK